MQCLPTLWITEYVKSDSASYVLPVYSRAIGESSADWQVTATYILSSNNFLVAFATSVFTATQLQAGPRRRRIRFEFALALGALPIPDTLREQFGRHRLPRIVGMRHDPRRIGRREQRA